MNEGEYTVVQHSIIFLTVWFPLEYVADRDSAGDACDGATLVSPGSASRLYTFISF